MIAKLKEEDKLDEAGMANEGKKFDKAYDAWHKSTVQLTRALEKDAGNKSGVSKFKKALQDIENAIDASDLEESVEEAKSKFSKALLKKATDTALKMGGNMTGAVKEIEKMKKGLSKDKEVAAALQLANEEVSEAILVAAHEINETKTKVQEDKERYQKFFNSALKKFGVNSPAELKGDKKKEFFDYVDKNYEADNETD
jgi:predicted DNA binding CopG/RHH family protein